jgi:PhoH-like ATPase
MPLPKPPTKPATLLDLDSAPLARATRTKPRIPPDAAPPAAALHIATVGSNRKAALLQAAPVGGLAGATAAGTPALAPSAALASAPMMAPPLTAPITAPMTASIAAPIAAPIRPQAPADARAVAAAPIAEARTASTNTRSSRPARNARAGASARPEQSAVATTVAQPVLPTPRPAKTSRAATPRAALTPEAIKLFVLDTNVLLHDPSSLFRFEEHDIFLPIVTLEELDNNKKGMSEVARNARQVSRSLDALVGDVDEGIEQGILLDKLGSRDAIGRLFLQTQALETSLPETLAAGKADNQILGVVQGLQRKFAERQVVLVSKDINMRIKARALGLRAEDYHNDQVIDDLDLLYGGTLALPANFWERHSKGMESWQQGGHNFYRISGPAVASFTLNQFVYLEGDMPLSAQVKELNGKTAVLQTLRDYGHPKHAVWGLTARNREQNFALNLLMNPEVDFVTLLGQAGTGKTLLALATGLAQTLEHKRYSEIIVTRATVPVGEDIGYLPGTEEEKMQPWMGALEDNLEVLNQGSGSGGEWGRAAATDLIRSRIKVKSMSFMRGRTFINKFLIIDEAQNLTPKQMKTLVTRAGPGTKVICLGNIAQIDTPYLTEGSSGLTYVVDRFKGWGHSGHITLQRGERSRLADFAADAL